MAGSSILIYGPPGFDKKEFIQRVCSQTDVDDEITFLETFKADTQLGVQLHDVHIETKYYTAKINVFIDEPETTEYNQYQSWIQELMSPDMRELRDHLQCIIILSPAIMPDEDFDRLARLGEQLSEQLDEEHISEDADHLFWDGDLLVRRLRPGNLVEIAETCQQIIRCVEWRDMLRKTLPNTNANSAAPSSSPEVRITEMETALNQLRAARSKVRETGQGEVPLEVKAQVESLLDALLE